MKFNIYFSECEHEGDLDNYADDIRKADGIVISSSLDTGSEEGRITVETSDFKSFLERFKQTESYDFSHYAN